MKIETLHVASSRVPAFDVGGAQVRFLASGEPFKGRALDVILGTLTAGIFVPPHSHDEPEWFFLLEGEMEAYMGDEESGEWKSVRAGDLAVIPGGVRHAWRNRSSSPASVLSFGGSNIFAVMRALSVTTDQTYEAAAPTAEFLQKLQTVAAETGNWIGSPEQNAAIGLNL